MNLGHVVFARHRAIIGKPYNYARKGISVVGKIRYRYRLTVV